jgi:hypothetical protein
MGRRLDVDLTETKITDCLLLDIFHPVAKKLTGFVLQERSDGRVLILTDEERVIKHVVSNLDDNNWGCFCAEALDGECAATTFARARLMKDMDESPRRRA